jgi:hypothetical protein
MEKVEINYPWRCLCFGFFLQTTTTRPLRRTTWQSRHMADTDERTFIREYQGFYEKRDEVGRTE